MSVPHFPTCASKESVKMYLVCSGVTVTLATNWTHLVETVLVLSCFYSTACKNIFYIT